MKEKTYTDYFNELKIGLKCDKATEKAFEEAVKNRDFEIEHYWKRAIYFWTFIGLVFVAFFQLEKGNVEDYYLLKSILSIIGIVFSTAWVAVNKGSKYWQENWETHTVLLEQKVIGPLYSTVIDGNNKDHYKIRDFRKAYPFSVSSLNLILSIFILFIWTGLFLYTTFVYLRINSWQIICYYLCQRTEIFILYLGFLLFAGWIICKLLKAKSSVTNEDERLIIPHNIALKMIKEKIDALRNNEQNG
jgi:hypothetical protein